jgi:hypothetical protein
MSASAEAGTLGSENPSITCVFRTPSGENVDGNNLTAGDYYVDIVLSGLSAVSAFQFTATYTSDLTVVVNSTLATVGDGFEEAAVRYEEGRLGVGFISSNDNSTAVNKAGTVMATLAVTLTKDCDFADVFDILDDGDLTLVAVDYEDGYNPCYVSVNAGTSDIWFNNLTIDESPELDASTFNVTGQIVISTNTTGTAGAIGIGGITVSVDVNGNTVSAVTADDGSYTLPALPAGIYTMSIAGETTIDRSVTLEVTNDDKSVDAVPVVVCDYNKDGSINAVDKNLFNGSYNLATDFNKYCDLNSDGSVNAVDKNLFNALYNQTVTYNEVTL